MSGRWPSPDVVAIVLAGGASSRFGSDKLAVTVGGRPLLHHAVEAVGRVAERIIVVIAPGAPAPPLPGVLVPRVSFARDAAAYGGPLAGLAAGLALVAGNNTPVRDEAPRITPAVGARAGVTPTGVTQAGVTPAGVTSTDPLALERDRLALVVGGDMPSLVPDVLRLMAEALAAEPSLAVMTLAASGPAPLPMAVRPGAARIAVDAILASGGRRSLMALVDSVPSATLPAAAWRSVDPSGATLRDIDAPADLPG